MAGARFSDIQSGIRIRWACAYFPILIHAFFYAAYFIRTIFLVALYWPA